MFRLRDFAVKVVNAFLAVITFSRQHERSAELSQAGPFDLKAQVPTLDACVQAEQQ
jgi:hypothetical protein